MIYPPLIEAGIFPTEINCSSPPHLSREQSIIHMRFTGKKTASRMYCGMCLPDLCVTISDSCGSSGTSRRSCRGPLTPSIHYIRILYGFPALCHLALRSKVSRLLSNSHTTLYILMFSSAVRKPAVSYNLHPVSHSWKHAIPRVPSVFQSL